MDLVATAKFIVPASNTVLKKHYLGLTVKQKHAIICHMKMKEVLLTIPQYLLLKGIARKTFYRQMDAGKLRVYRDPKDKHWLILCEVEDVIPQI